MLHLTIIKRNDINSVVATILNIKKAEIKGTFKLIPKTQI